MDHPVRVIRVEIEHDHGRRVAEFHTREKVDDIVHDAGALGELVRSMIEVDGAHCVAADLASRPGPGQATACAMCFVEVLIGTEEVPHPIDADLHTCLAHLPDPMVGVQVPADFGDGDQVRRAMRGLNQTLRRLDVRADSGAMAALLVVARMVHGLGRAQGWSAQRQADAYSDLAMRAWTAVTGVPSVVITEAHHVAPEPHDPS